MRKILYIFLLLLIPIRVNALTGNVNLNCNPTSVSGDTIVTCNITASSDQEVNGFSADINLSNNISFVSFETDKSLWQGDGESGKIGLYTDKNKKGTFDIGILKVKINDNVFNSNEYISLDNCLYSDYNFNKVMLSNVKSDIRVMSSNNNLSDITLSSGNINFSSDITEYDLEVETSVININATKEDKNSTISGDIGNKNLNYGINTFKINVTSEIGTIKTYTLNIKRIDNRNGNNYLSKLTIDGYNINFDPDKGEYNITVNNDVNSININSILKDSNSYYVDGYEPGKKNLEIGLNRFEIKVSAENGSIRTYKINVTRKTEEKSNDNYLENIELDAGEIKFDKKTEEYKITVSNDTDKIDINASASSDKSKVEVIGNDNLKVGENEVIVKVTAEDGTIREYKIIVIKKEKDIILSNNNYLSNLIISNHDIDFDKDKYEYEIIIKNEKKLSIDAICEDENANFAIKGNSDLEDGSIIKIIVTAEDSSTRIYKINITKENERDYALIIVISIEILIIVGVILYFVLRKKKSDPNEQI